MHVRGLLTLLFVLSITAVFTGEHFSTGLYNVTSPVIVVRNHIGFEVGFLDMFLISLCFLVFFVQNERNKINEVYRQRLVVMRNKCALQENAVVGNLLPIIDGYRSRNTRLALNLIKMNKETNGLLKNVEGDVAALKDLNREFESFKSAWIQDTKTYPQSEAAVLKQLVLVKIRTEISSLKEYIGKELQGLHQEIHSTRDFVHEVNRHGY